MTWTQCNSLFYLIKFTPKIFSMLRFALPLLSLLLVFGSCKKDKDQNERDEEIIKEYIASHGLNAQSTGSGLYYVIDNPGNGKTPHYNSDVQVAYKGFLTDGTVFDESSSTGIWLNLQQVIIGWQEGIPLFNEGGSGTLLIPSSMGYGNQATGNIPPNSVLIFEITLRDVR